MAEVKIAADSGGGSISLKGPSTTTGNANVAFVLPVADGSAGQYLKTDGSKNFGWVSQPTSFDKLNLSGTANSSEVSGDMWYESGKFHFIGTGGGVWSTGATISSTRAHGSGNGTLFAGLITSGTDPADAYGVWVQEYNGTAWTTKTSVSTEAYSVTACGTTSAALKWGGYNGSSYLKTTEEYNGSSWSAGGEPSATIGMASGGAGTQTAALCLGGRGASSTYLSSCEKYDGTSWSSTAAISGTRYEMMAGGTQTAAISAGGSNNGTDTLTLTEEFDGTSWSSSNNMSTSRFSGGMGGTQTSFMASCGLNYDSGNYTRLNSTELYNGTTWSAGPTAVYTLSGVMGAGGAGNGFTAGGNDGTSGYENVTQDYEASIDGLLTAEGL